MKALEIKKIRVYYVDREDNLQEFIKTYNKTGIEIELMPLNEILDEI